MQTALCSVSTQCYSCVIFTAVRFDKSFSFQIASEIECVGLLIYGTSYEADYYDNRMRSIAKRRMSINVFQTARVIKRYQWMLTSLILMNVD